VFLQEQQGLLESVERDTDGVMSRMSANMHKMQEVIKKMSSCKQMVIIAVLIIVVVVLLFLISQ
jgi:hypothetical protein